MKLQGMSVVFALVAIPLILVLTYYIQLQVDTINLQSEYDTKLLGATYDAMSSFEINTANEDLSSVSDSLRTIIEASSNVFINTLATNLGMSNASKSYIEPYIPALLYTLYDGYYIYSPTKVPTVLTDSDGNAVSVGDAGVKCIGTDYTYTTYPEGTDDDSKEYLKIKDLTNEDDYGQLLYLKKGTTSTYTSNIEEAEFETQNVLKTYMPYSARYQGTDFDITIIYTLDNYVTIQGSIEEIYYTKSGYLLPQDSTTKKVSCVEVEEPTNLLDYNQNDAQEYIEAGNTVRIKIGDAEISVGGTNYADANEDINALNSSLQTAQTLKSQIEKGIISNDDASVQEFLDNTGYISLQEAINGITLDINKIQYELDKISAVVYYVKATIFSNWVYGNLSNIKESDLIEIAGQNYTLINGNQSASYYNFADSDDNIFNVTGSTTKGIIEIDEDSVFYTHKLNVIRESIQYNLNLAMSTYTNVSAKTYDYSMPVISNDEWEQVLTNVSLISFMQGYQCGLKTYNNYMIVSSTNNEISVSPENIYYVEKNHFSDESTEYHKIDCPKLYDIDQASGNTAEYIAFTSKEVKYDKIYDKNNSILPYTYDHKNFACYDCINDGNYDALNILSDTTNSSYSNLRKAYYIGIGKARNNLYKMNAIDNSQGYEVIYMDYNSLGHAKDVSSSLGLNNIKSIEIVVGTLKTHDSNETVLRYRITDGTQNLNNETYSIVSNSTQDYTITVNVDPTISSTSPINLSDLRFINENSESTVYDKGTDGNEYTGTDDETNTRIFSNAVKYIRVIYK